VRVEKVRFESCYFCDDAVLIGEDYIEIREEMNKPEDRSVVDPELGNKGPINIRGMIVGRPRVVMLTSHFMHRKCWYQYKLHGSRPKRHRGQPVGERNGKSTVRTS
jgi:hypothetical protein